MLASIEIALATFREARRNKILYSTLFFAVVILFNSFLISEVTIHSQDRVLRDFGLAAIGFFGVLISIFLSVAMVNREIERKTIYMVISKPVSRAEVVVGKTLGVGLTLAVTLGIMFLAFLCELLLYRSPIEKQLFIAVAGLGMQLLIVSAFGVFSSTFTTPALSSFFCGSFFVLGNLSHDLRFFASKSSSQFVQSAGEWLYVLLPDLRRLNFSVEATHSLPIEAGQVLYPMAYGLLWVVFFVILGVMVLSRRDLK